MAVVKRHVVGLHAPPKNTSAGRSPALLMLWTVSCDSEPCFRRLSLELAAATLVDEAEAPPFPVLASVSTSEIEVSETNASTPAGEGGGAVSGAVGAADPVAATAGGGNIGTAAASAAAELAELSQIIADDESARLKDTLCDSDRIGLLAPRPGELGAADAPAAPATTCVLRRLKLEPRPPDDFSDGRMGCF